MLFMGDTTLSAMVFSMPLTSTTLILTFLSNKSSFQKNPRQGHVERRRVCLFLRVKHSVGCADFQTALLEN